MIYRNNSKNIKSDLIIEDASLVIQVERAKEQFKILYCHLLKWYIQPSRQSVSWLNSMKLFRKE